MPYDQIKLSHAAIQINTELVESIIETVLQAGGTISFADYMQRALYHPRLGYYQNELKTFGEQGDFVTAPELGSIFSQAIFSVLSEGGDKSLDILEFGAGTGSLAKNFIQACINHNVAINYTILEPSAHLRSLQQKNLKHFNQAQQVEIRWLNQLPKTFSGVILANEVVDAIPFQCIQKIDGYWQMLGVEVTEQGFAWRPLGDMAEDSIPEILRDNLDDYPDGYRTEVRPLAGKWLKSVADILTDGHIILFDYGYPDKELYHPQRVEGTLNCFSRHIAHNNPFELVGLQDITAHVDFTHLAKASHDCGLAVNGFTTQSGFILDSGYLQQLGSQSHSQIDTYSNSRQLQLLMAPGQMGELIKVMHLSKAQNSPIRGFSLQNHLHRL